MTVPWHRTTFQESQRLNCRRLAFALLFALIGCLLSLFFIPYLTPQIARAKPGQTFLGFDRNDYPGDSRLAGLRKVFSFTGYWLNVPPGAKNNTWIGKRTILREARFGFVVLFNGRADAELRKSADPGATGRADAEAAVEAARHEGFPANTVIFLDQEEGGRMLPEQNSYIYAWVDGVSGSGYRAGIYCSGIAAPGDGNVVTAADIRANAGARGIVYWVANDQCPPSQGCGRFNNPPTPAESGVRFADVWQYAQSPRRTSSAQACRNYAADGNCYAPGWEGEKVFVDLNAAGSEDPSSGR
jgi:Rv2525c-like, glycoside hydrolase-like domain